MNGLFIAVKPRPGITRRRGAGRRDDRAARACAALRPGQRNTFDMITQDQILDIFNKLTGVFFLVMIVLSGVGADGRRDRGDGDHDGLGDEPHARDRRAQGARRDAAATSCSQFLVEAATLTGVGGLDRDRRRAGVRQAGDAGDEHRGHAAARPHADRRRGVGRRSASPSACSPRCARRGSIRSRRCDTSSLSPWNHWTSWRSPRTATTSSSTCGGTLIKAAPARPAHRDHRPHAGRDGNARERAAPRRGGRARRPRCSASPRGRTLGAA